jgi:NADPH:quinone reductase-like Zn-dependent oxidoreductase
MACRRSNCLEVRFFSLRDVCVLNRNFRAAIINAGVSEGCNLLVTGAGGGVALLAVQLSVAKGAKVFVTSGSNQKIQKLLSLGVKGGVNYKHGEWIQP